MIATPATIALTSGSFFISLFTLYSAGVGLQILHGWDMGSGSEEQLALERKTYLVSSILTYALVLELLSLGVFVYYADRMHTLFVGAMCAAGVLDVNPYGYPTLSLKLLNFFLCGLWLIVNRVDNKAPDYPLVRPKYKLLLVAAGTLLLETYLQTRYFLGLVPDVVTSCCGMIFGTESRTLLGEMAHLPAYPMQVLFFLSVALTFRTGLHFRITGHGARIFAGLSLWLTGISLLSIIAFISLYFYELPTHHCPFCLIQREYYHVGYGLYLSLFTAGITGAATGLLQRFQDVPSLRDTIPRVQRRLTGVSLAAFAIFMALSAYPMIFSEFTLKGY